MAVGVRLKFQKEAIAFLINEGYGVEPIRFCRGDHLFVKVTKDGQSVNTTIAGTPSSASFIPLLSGIQRQFTALKAG